MFRMVRSNAIPCPRPSPGRWTLATLALLGLLLLPSTGVQAAEMFYKFNVITNNNASNSADVEANITMRVSNDTSPINSTAKSGWALFEFFVDSSAPSLMSIHEVYFDDGTLLALSSVFNDFDDSTNPPTGVQFSPGGDDPKLPGGKDIDPNFTVTAGFVAESVSPTSHFGVSPGESLGIGFILQPGKNIKSIFDALKTGANLKAEDDPTGTLRVGIHVGGLGSRGSGSESAINGPPENEPPVTPVPGPGALPLAFSGLGAAGLLGWTRKLRRRKSVA